MEMSLLVPVALVMVVFFFFVYSLLDGFDLGIAMALPFLRDREKAFGIMVPFWDGNEVWLIIVVGFIFAAFPPVYALLLQLLYLPLLAVLLAFIARAVTIEMLQHQAQKSIAWYWLLSVASTAITVAGTAVAALVACGLKFTGETVTFDVHAFADPFLYLFTIGATATVVAHGMAYLRTRKIDIAENAGQKWCLIIAVSAALAIAVCIGAGIVRQPVGIVANAGMVFVIAGMVAGRVSRRAVVKFTATGGALAGWWICIGAFLYRGLFAPGIAVESFTAPLSTMKLIVPFAVCITPVILVYTRFVYRVIGGTSRDPATTK